MTDATDPTTLATSLQPVERRLVMLDFDGVLAPIVDRPDQAVPSGDALDAVRRLAEITTVAIVSGRPIADLVTRLHALPVIYAGGHGAELQQPDGTYEHLVDVDALTATLDELEGRLRALVDDQPGWLVERKDASLAVHHRLAPAEQVDELLPRVGALLDAAVQRPPGFTVISGKAVVELRPDGVDKGRALDRIAEQTPELSPLMVGDDVTDEDAFRAALARGGTAILVAEQDRQTAAPYRVQDPDAVAVLLTALADMER